MHTEYFKDDADMRRKYTGKTIKDFMSEKSIQCFSADKFRSTTDKYSPKVV